MKANITFADKIIRLIIAVVFISLSLKNIVTGPAGIIMIVLAIVLTATALLNFCPLYTFLGIRRWEKKV